jgi:hypothetical protein
MKLEANARQAARKRKKRITLSAIRYPVSLADPGNFAMDIL